MISRAYALAAEDMGANASIPVVRASTTWRSPQPTAPSSKNGRRTSSGCALTTHLVSRNYGDVLTFRHPDGIQFELFMLSAAKGC